MDKLIVDNNGKVRSADRIAFADKIMQLRASGGPWAVIEELLKYWSSTAPDEVHAVKIDVEDQRELIVDKKYGQTLGGKGMERRFQILFPTNLQALIRSVYKADELPFDSAFYREFSRRFPYFKVAEVV